MRFALSTLVAAAIVGTLCTSSSASAQVQAAQPVPATGVAHAGGVTYGNEYVAGDYAAADGGYVVDGDVIDGGVVDGAVVGVNGRWYGHPDLFYNYYTQGAANTVNAQMYISPLPVPPYVGHTFYTYQPFYPHHMMYTHHDRYHQHYDYGRGLNRTHAIYRPSAPQLARDFYFNWIRLPR